LKSLGLMHIGLHAEPLSAKDVVTRRDATQPTALNLAGTTLNDRDKRAACIVLRDKINALKVDRWSLQFSRGGLHEAAMLRLVAENGSLRELNLDGAYIRNDALRALNGAKALQALSLAGCEFLTDDIVEGLSNISTLRRLDISGCGNLTNSAFKHL